MKTKDALFLGFKKLIVRPKSSTYLILSVSAIMFLVFAINFLFIGFRNLYLKFASQGTDGKTILVISPDGEGELLDEIILEIEKFNGELLGKTKYYDNYTGIILPEKFISPLIAEKDADSKGASVQILASTFLGESLLGNEFPSGTKSYETYKNLLIGKHFFSNSGTELFIAGFAPGDFHSSNFSFKNLDKNHSSLFDPILEKIGTSSSRAIVIDDGNLDPEKITEFSQFTTVFQDHTDAYAFLKNGHGNSAHTAFENETYQISCIAGPDPDVLYMIDTYGFIKDIFNFILLFIALIIIIFSFIRIYSGEKKSIALFRSLSATSSDIRKIYSVYFMGIFFLAVGISFVCSAIAVLISFALNADLLLDLFTITLSLV